MNTNANKRDCDLTEKEKKIINKYKEGWSIRKIAKHFSCGRTTVSRILKENNIKIRSHKQHYAMKRAKIAELYLQGYGINEIIKKLKYSRETVVNFLQYRGFILTQRDRQTLQIARYIELKNQGLETQKIAAILEVSENYLNKLLINSGINVTIVRQKTQHIQNLSEIISKFLKGVTLDYLMDSFNIGENELKWVLSAFGLYTHDLNLYQLDSLK